MIRVYEVRVVDEDGSQLGVMRTADALRLAQERGLDLVEVAPLASPPVSRLLDFGQYKYELTKREKEAKRKQRSVTFKEVRLKPKIGVGDFDTKVRRAIEFLEHGVIERPPLLEGKSMHISVASTHKPKMHESTPSATAKAHARPADGAIATTDGTQEAKNEASPAPPARPRPEPDNGAASTGV